jgi:hypothetical protein
VWLSCGSRELSQDLLWLLPAPAFACGFLGFPYPTFLCVLLTP